LGRTGRTREGEPASREVERRREILRAAIEVFAKKGYHGCRIADVAQEAGVAYGLVYHYFKNKEELLGSVFELAWSGFVSRVEEVARGPGNLEQKVRRIAQVTFDAYRADPRAVKVLILEIARSPAATQVNRQSAFGEVIRLAEEMFQDAARRGELHPELDPRLGAALLFGALEMGLTTLVLGLFDPRDPAVLEQVKTQIAETFLRGVRPPQKG
jgi:TetR/AcrR family transcriptional regulator, fatty acid metabolism regulator protein